MAETKVCIVGTGYVGMASAIGLAELGCHISGFDIVPERIAMLRNGVAPYREAGINEALRKHIAAGRMEFHQDFHEAVEGSDFVVIAVGTPARSNGSADISAVDDVISLLSEMDGELPTVILRSTVPPGTSERVAARLAGRAELIYAPEFLREGSAVFDFLNPDRVVLGGSDYRALAQYAAIFESLDTKLVLTSRTNAELIKGCSNAFLAMKISYANEVANLCEQVGAEADEVLRGMGYDRRIGSDFLQPGIGFGGPCFEKDVKSLAFVSANAGTEHELVSAVLRVNHRQPRKVVDMLVEELGTLDGVEIGVWGLAFKAGTDDVRDSLALRILSDLVDRGANVRAFDPAISLAALPSGCALASDAFEAAECDALLVLTEWPVFNRIDPAEIALRVRSRVVIDGRNCLDPHRMVAAGIRYRGVGLNNFIDRSEEAELAFAEGA
jgi:UDPglucose 6-dehydrogenase